MKVFIVVMLFIGSLFFAFFLGKLEAQCIQPYTHIEEPEDRIGYIKPCPNCQEDTLTIYYNGTKIVKSECNNCNFELEN